MRLALCVVMMAVSLVSLQCTANASDINDSGHNTEEMSVGTVTTTTTASAQSLSEGVQKTGDDGAEKDKQDIVERKTEQHNNAEEGHTQRRENAQRENTVNGLGERVIPLPKPSVTTTTTSVNDKPAQHPDGSQRETTQNKRGQTDLKERGASRPAPELGNSITTEVKTTTTTTAGQTLSGSQEHKVKEQSTQPKEEDATDIKVHDAAVAATTTTTHAPTNTPPKESKIQQSVNNKDGSSSTSLLLAFAMIATLAVIDVAPV